ncbi:branched-chain amino acid ABC transporter permease [Ochrobactrum sp. CGA5]|uniref:branched-chain amino acid ABC transporter permease n=1 Tax=Ochrobactrum sp. CGA5 TaxID=2583453 RepID=UPI001120EACC|nr:branched-chain amino acid ABC transporter permease [Ochrobactrum sp. CGA5]
MDEMATIVISGMSAIAALVLISIGLAVIFGLMRVVNMAHGELLMVGALTTTTLVNHVGLPWWLAMAAAPFTGAAVGVLLNVVLISRIPQGRLVDTLLVTFGASLVLYQLAVNIFGTTPPGIATPLGAVGVGDYSVSAYSIFLIVAAAVLAAGLYLLFTRTQYGLLARAAAQNPQMAEALGVASTRVNLISFALGCGLAALGGALMAPMISVSPSLGQAFVGQAFMTVVIAGPAFISGTLLAALLLGGISNGLSQGLTNLWGITGLFVVAIIILRIRPVGLSGKWKRAL